MEENNEEITSDISRDSFLPEQLPEASFEMEPTAPVPPSTIQTRAQSALERGIPRRPFSHFGYPSESESDQEQMGQPIEEPQQPMIYPDIDDLEPLYSDQEEVKARTNTKPDTLAIRNNSTIALKPSFNRHFEQFSTIQFSSW